MRGEVPTWVVAVVIVVVLAIVVFAYWYSGRTRAPVEEQKLPATHQPAPQPINPTFP